MSRGKTTKGTAESENAKSPIYEDNLAPLAAGHEMDGGVTKGSSTDTPYEDLVKTAEDAEQDAPSDAESKTAEDAEQDKTEGEESIPAEPPVEPSGDKTKGEGNAPKQHETIELVCGASYRYGDMKFLKGAPVEVSADIAARLLSSGCFKVC